MRAVINVATGAHYIASQNRLKAKLAELNESLICWTDELPAGSPPHWDTPYAFKARAIWYAQKQGYRSILWADASIVPIRPLAPLWDLIESQGYWFSLNPPYADSAGTPWNCGQWTCDSALDPLGVTREELFGIPQVIATSFGLCFKHEIAVNFFAEFFGYAEHRTAFRGPWRNDNHEASMDDRVKGHRHDQTVASVIAHRLGMKLTRPPQWIVDGDVPTEETILTIHR